MIRYRFLRDVLMFVIILDDDLTIVWLYIDCAGTRLGNLYGAMRVS